MKEKVAAFLHNEKVKEFNKKVFSKKTFIAVIVAIVIITALRITFLLMFEVSGTVNKVDGTKITVTNFLTTQTVDVGDYPIATTGIQAGDRIKIMKNLSGQVYSVRCQNRRNMIKGGKQGIRRFNGKAGQNFRKRN